MKTRLIPICFLLLLSFFACKKQESVEIKGDTLANLPFENDDFKIEIVSNINKNIGTAHFFNELDGISYDYGMIYNTNDKGAKWKKTFGNWKFGDIANDTITFVNSFKIVDKDVIIASGYSYNKNGHLKSFIIKSADKGDTWQTQYEISEPATILLQTDESKSLIIAALISTTPVQNTVFMKSIDNGKSWETISTLDRVAIDKLYIISKSKFVATSLQNRYISNNAAKTWDFDAPEQIFPNEFFNFKFGEGYGITSSNTNSMAQSQAKKILKSTDDGNTWSEVNWTSHTLNILRIPSPKTVFAFGNGFTLDTYESMPNVANIIYTKDAGATWKQVLLSCSPFKIVSFYDEKNGYLITDDLLCKITLK